MMMQVAECFRKRKAYLQYPSGGQPSVGQIGPQSVGNMVFRGIEDSRSGGLPGRGSPIASVLGDSISLLHLGVVRQFHYVIEISRRIVPPDVEERQLAGMRPRDAFKPLDSLEFPLEWPVIVEAVPPDNLRRAPHSGRCAARQPDLTIRTNSHAPQQLVIGHYR